MLLTERHIEQNQIPHAARPFPLSLCGGIMQVTQYHFTDWPDFGVPASAISFAEFVRVVMAAQHKAAATSKASEVQKEGSRPYFNPFNSDARSPTYPSCFSFF
jgi:hypothetical protein